MFISYCSIAGAVTSVIVNACYKLYIELNNKHWCLILLMEENTTHFSNIFIWLRNNNLFNVFSALLLMAHLFSYT